MDQMFVSVYIKKHKMIQGGVRWAQSLMMQKNKGNEIFEKRNKNQECFEHGIKRINEI